MATRKRSKRPPRTRLLLRWGGVGVFCLLAYLYFKPVDTYFAKRHQLAATQSEVRGLRAQQTRLQRLVAAASSDAELAREARRLGLVLPGERLFIVKGIPRWLKEHPTTVRGDG